MNPETMAAVLSRHTPANRIARLREHPELAKRVIELEIWFSELGGKADATLLLAISDAEQEALNLKVEPILSKARARRAKGGVAAAKVRIGWHEDCVKRARGLLAKDAKDRKELHEITGILAKRFKRDPKTIRTVLKNAGIR